MIAFGGTETGENGGAGHHIKIQNKTFIGSLACPISYWPIGISLDNCPYATVKKNIVYDQVNDPIYFSGSSCMGLEIGYNCTYNSDGTTPFGTPQPDERDENGRFSGGDEFGAGRGTGETIIHSFVKQGTYTVKLTIVISRDP